MRHCPTCGKELPDTARFCSHCGEILSAPATIDRSTNTTQMNNSQPADAQLRDVSAVPTLQLTNHAEQEQAPASTPDTILSDLPQLEAPVGNGHPFAKGGSMAQEASH